MLPLGTSRSPRIRLNEEHFIHLHWLYSPSSLQPGNKVYVTLTKTKPISNLSRDTRNGCFPGSFLISQLKVLFIFSYKHSLHVGHLNLGSNNDVHSQGLGSKNKQSEKLPARRKMDVMAETNTAELLESTPIFSQVTRTVSPGSCLELLSSIPWMMEYNL